MSDKIKIVFMGTAEFAVASLDALYKNGYHIAAVVAPPDKPSGRGLKICPSPVGLYAREKNIKLLQPIKLKDPEFLNELNTIQPDLQIVVAFRMLPEHVWKLPRLGTFNLHASLLPDYRGAAPINRAIMNGETRTGVTTFFINENIDTGNILLQSELTIEAEETAGELHNRLMEAGADLVLKTVKQIENGNISGQPQNTFLKPAYHLNAAPKIFKEDCIIPWMAGAVKIHNHIRGLSPYPAAYTELISPENNSYYIKVFRCLKQIEAHEFSCGKIITDGKTFVRVAVPDGFIDLLEIQLQAKKKMLIGEFLRGFPLIGNWTVKVI